MTNQALLLSPPPRHLKYFILRSDSVVDDQLVQFNFIPRECASDLSPLEEQIDPEISGIIDEIDLNNVDDVVAAYDPQAAENLTNTGQADPEDPDIDDAARRVSDDNCDEVVAFETC